jgi:predicted GNAT superfamily acetyltransferase
MKNFVTLTARRELMFFTANDYTEANYICGGERYKELYTPVRNCVVKSREELRGIEQELYRELINL